MIRGLAPSLPGISSAVGSGRTRGDRSRSSSMATPRRRAARRAPGERERRGGPAKGSAAVEADRISQPSTLHCSTAIDTSRTSSKLQGFKHPVRTVIHLILEDPAQTFSRKRMPALECGVARSGAALRVELLVWICKGLEYRADALLSAHQEADTATRRKQEPLGLGLHVSSADG